MGTSLFSFVGALYFDEETSLRVLGVGNGEVLPELRLHGVLARIVLVILDGGACRHTCVDEESFKELHEEEGVHQVLPGADEDESEHNRADGSKIERTVLEVAGRAIDAEYHVEHEEVVKGEHPLRQVACHPRHGEPNPPAAP